MSPGEVGGQTRIETVMAPRDDPENGEQTFDEVEASLGKRKRSRKAQLKTEPVPPRVWWFQKSIMLIASATLGFLFLCGGLTCYFSGPRITDDPAEVLIIQNEICNMNLPPEYKPRGGFRMSTWGRKSKSAMFSVGEPSLTHALTIIEYAAKEVTESQLDNGFSRNNNRSNSEIRFEQEETKRITIEGQERSFRFSIFITKSDDGAECRSRMVSGQVFSKSGYATIFLMAPETDYDESAVIGMLESIHR